MDPILSEAKLFVSKDDPDHSPETSFEAASRRLRTKRLEPTKLRKSALKIMKSLSRVTLCALRGNRAVAVMRAGNSVSLRRRDGFAEAPVFE